MGKKSRTKGHTYERETAVKFQAVFPDAKRHLEYQAGEANGVDLDNTGNLAIQCKRYKGYAPINKIFEVDAPGKIPVLVTKADRQPDMVILPLADFIRILGDIGTVYDD